MIQPLEFRFALNKEDFTRGVRAFYIRQSSTWIFMLLLAVFTLVSWVLFGIPSFALGVISLLPLLLYVVFLFVVAPLWLGWKVQHNERLRADTTWRIADDRIAISSQFAEGSFDWGTFRRVIETPDAYLLVYSINKNMFQIVPKRALTEPQQAAFKQILAQKLTGLRAASA